MAEAKDNNNEPACQSLKRVWSFLVDISKYIQQRSAFNRALKRKTATQEMVLRAADSDFDLQKKLNATLDGYSFVATVDSDALRFRGRFDADSLTSFGGPEVFQEADAILSVFQLAQQNHTWRVRLCSRKKCLRFFYARNRIQRFCPDGACRSAFWHAFDAEAEREYWDEQKSQGRLKPKRRTHR